jgi:hypothetical protein
MPRAVVPYAEMDHSKQAAALARPAQGGEPVDDGRLQPNEPLAG